LFLLTGITPPEADYARRSAAGVNSGPVSWTTPTYDGFMEIVRPNDSNYDKAKQIANARFDYLRPAMICYCRNEEDVRDALLMAKKNKLHVRIRSGGHQHEGMCSGDNVLIIDVSG
jgi:hypothetical protein